jgi:hypothetical protein
MDHAAVARKISIAEGVKQNLTPMPVCPMFAVSNTWLPSQGQDLRWGQGVMFPGLQGPVAMQQSAELPHGSGDADFSGKGAGKQGGNRQKISEPTTIFFRNVPNNCSGKKILELLNNNGFRDSYDFVYVPHDFKRLPQLVTLGYFFVNFVSHDVAQKALDQLVGFKDWESPESTKVLDASWATQTQGFKQCVKRYRNCPVMHETVPEECKPMAFENGVPVLLAASKKKIKQPRFKKGYLVDGKSTPEAPAGALDDNDTQAISGDDDPKDDGLNTKDDGIEDAGVQSSTSMVWMPDDSTVVCSRCEEPFTMFRRRHHCRACGLICCAECAPRTSSNWPKMLRNSQESTFKRLCKDCHASPVYVHGRRSLSPAHSQQAFVKNTFINIKEEPLFCSMFASKTSLSDSFPY